MGAEKNFENNIKKFLDEQGCYYIKHFANAFTKVGVPDILASVNGYFVAIEVKASNGRPSELQLYNIKKINMSGGIGIVLYPNDFGNFVYMVNCLLKGQETEAYSMACQINKRWWDNAGVTFKD